MEEGDEISHSDEAEVHNPGALGVVDQLVDPAGPEATFDVKVDVRGCEVNAAVAALGLCKLPFTIRDRLARVALELAGSQCRIGAVEHGIAFNVRTPAHRHRQHAIRVRDELLTDAPAHELTVLACLWQVSNNVVAIRDQVALPAGPNYCVALSHEETVPRPGGAPQLAGAAVVETHRPPPTTVRELVEEPAV